MKYKIKKILISRGHLIYTSRRAAAAITFQTVKLTIKPCANRTLLNAVHACTEKIIIIPTHAGKT